MDNAQHPKLSLEYLVRYPVLGTSPAPLLVLLHGYGSNEADLFALEEHFPKEFLVVSARAPGVLSAGQYAWFAIDFSNSRPVANMEQAEEARVRVRNFLDEVVQHFTVDTTRLFLGGFSQGGMLALSVGLTYPGLLRGILPLSGRIVPSVKERSLALAGMHTTAVFLAHGTSDQVIPVSFARDARDHLRNLGLPLEYHEYPIAHTIAQAEVRDIAVWLSAQITV